jgi:hypothetical protein
VKENIVNSPHKYTVPERKGPLEDTGVHGETILKWTWRAGMGRHRQDSSTSWKGELSGCREHGNKSLSSIN